MRRSCEPTKMRPAEKGDRQECDWSFSRWILHQDPRARRHVGAADPPPDHARPAARVHGRGSDHRRPRAGQSVRSRHWLRLECDPQGGAAQAHEGGNLSEPVPQQTASLRQGNLRLPLPRRGVLPPRQALPGSGDSLREDGTQLPGAAPPRRNDGLATRCGAPALLRYCRHPLVRHAG